MIMVLLLFAFASSVRKVLLAVVYKAVPTLFLLNRIVLFVCVVLNMLFLYAEVVYNWLIFIIRYLCNCH